MNMMTTTACWLVTCIRCLRTTVRPRRVNSGKITPTCPLGKADCGKESEKREFLKHYSRSTVVISNVRMAPAHVAFVVHLGWCETLLGRVFGAIPKGGVVALLRSMLSTSLACDNTLRVRSCDRVVRRHVTTHCLPLPLPPPGLLQCTSEIRSELHAVWETLLPPPHLHQRHH